MEQEQVAAWLVEWLAARAGPVPGETLAEQLDVDMFAAHLIDSMGVIELVSAAEERFAIRFTETQFQERRFSKIGGLAAIIGELARR